MAEQRTKTGAARADTLAIRGKLSDLYYFAYGSDMNAQQITTRCAKPVAVGAARLAGYRLAFYGYSRTWDGGLETVVPDPGREVLGVLYALNLADWERLDQWWDVRLDGAGVYFHFPAAVADTQGKTHTVLLYKKDDLSAPRPPSREYLDFIVQGGLERGLGADYLEELRRIESGKAQYDVPRRKKISLEFLA
ncbi:MAG: gamma-glutamylcyclotransferase [Desulfovibrionaceae bacterium]|nr:gamma-glutamylcyclotransferase [Desulfovibrionaceae bacterium]MBF0513673.1 gamma-glutamylcyclotransferase [Desulfovibrionaceae bacterium]